jgi:hypothetical protein
MSENSLNLVPLTESYAICLSTEGKSRKTIEWYSNNLNRFARFLEDNRLSLSVDEIGIAEARLFISHLQTGVKRWEGHYNIKDDKPLSSWLAGFPAACGSSSPSSPSVAKRLSTT